MNFDYLDRDYISGNYDKIVKDLSENNISFLNSTTRDVDKAICNSYLIRSLIRLGRIKEAEKLLERSEMPLLQDHFKDDDLINETTVINLLLTNGKTHQVITRNEHNLNVINQFQNNSQKVIEFWGCFYFYLIGIAYYYELNYKESVNYFFKSLKLNQSNFLIKGKSYYYLAWNELEQHNKTNYNKYLEKSTQIFEKINAKQGLGWNLLWVGNILIQKGDYEQATKNLEKSSELFKSIGATQELNLIKSLFGMLSFRKGALDESRRLLNESFSSSITLGNPMISSYILLPFILVNIDAGNRKLIEENLKLFEDFNKDPRVLFHLKLGKALFLKSSTKLFDKAQAEKLFLELLEKSNPESNYLYATGDNSVIFFLIFNLAELFYMEFLLSNDVTLLKDIQQLLDNFRKSTETEISNEIIEISILRSKILVVEGKIEEALNELNLAKDLAMEHGYVKQIEQIDKEITMIHNEIEKWGTTINMLQRIKAVDMDKYIKEAQKLPELKNEFN